MSSQNINNLIGFLAKKSLFETTSRKTPNKYPNLKQQSQILSRTIITKSKIQSTPQIQQLNVFRDHSEKYLGLNKFGQSQAFNFSPKTFNKEVKTKQQISRFASSKVPNKSSSNIQTPTRRINIRQTNPQLQLNYFKSGKDNKKNLFMGFTPITQNGKSEKKAFQSTRLQSAQYLENISLRLKNSIQMMNSKLDEFNVRISKTLNYQLKALKEKVYDLVEEICKKSEKDIKEYIKKQQILLTKEVKEVKEILLKNYQKVGAMKTQIQGSSWRKVVGELISSQMQDKIEQVLKRSQNIQISRLQLKQMGDSNISNLHNILKQIAQSQS